MPASQTTLVRSEPVPSTSARGRAIERAVTLRALHRSLAREFAASAPPGQVLATAVRCSQALRRGGCAADLIPGATERMVRATLTARAW